MALGSPTLRPPRRSFVRIVLALAAVGLTGCPLPDGKASGGPLEGDWAGIVDGGSCPRDTLVTWTLSECAGDTCTGNGVRHFEGEVEGIYIDADFRFDLVVTYDPEGGEQPLNVAAPQSGCTYSLDGDVDEGYTCDDREDQFNGYDVTTFDWDGADAIAVEVTDEHCQGELVRQ